MSNTIDAEEFDVIEPLDDLRDDELWDTYERDRTAGLMLDIARKQAQTTLGLIDSKLKDILMFRGAGDIPAKEANFAIYELNKKRRGTLVFLQLVETRQMKYKARKLADVRHAIEQHRYQSEQADYEPTEFDRKLWAVLEEGK